jgi:hypothetical protein
VALLFGISLLALFFEIVMIRCIPACVMIISFYTNLVLISCFLGLGLGCVIAGADRTPRVFRSFPFLLLIELVVLAIIKIIGIAAVDESWGEKLWDWGWGKLDLLSPMLAPIIVFVLNTATFIPLGRILGTSIERFHPLPGYSINIIGSTLGVSLLAFFNLFGLGPLAWLAVGFGLLMLLYWWMGRSRLWLIRAVIFLILSLGVVAYSMRNTIWSPYYQIKLEKVVEERPILEKILKPELSQDLGLIFLIVNDGFFQFAMNLDPYIIEQVSQNSKEILAIPSLREMLWALHDAYALPYRSHPPGRTLILGSGLGNDVAAALREGVIHVDAVEIDPVIAELGRKLHPENPYGRPDVTLHITDARRFLRMTDNTYDLIVYGLLDSHALFSSLSSLRLDNFVYTREGFAQAKRHLNQDGMIVLMFSTSSDFVGQRLFHLLDDTFPNKTYGWSWVSPTSAYGFSGFSGFIAGPQLDKFIIPPDRLIKDITENYRETPRPDLPTDDWPFLYLRSKSISTDYAKVLLILLLISIIFTRRLIPQTRTIKLHFFLLGGGFLLLETKSITEISLLFGSTWIVNSVVIAAFLLMNFIATLYVMIGRALPKIQWLYALLTALLIINYFIPVNRLLLESSTATLLLGAMFVSAPVFFSGAIFAMSFRETDNVPAALGSNLLGAVVGGFSEYLCLFAGFKALYLLAIAFYALSLIFRKR